MRYFILSFCVSLMMLFCFTSVAANDFFVSQGSYYISFNGQRTKFDPKVDIQHIHKNLSERQSFNASILKLKERHSDLLVPLSFNALRRGDKIVIKARSDKNEDVMQIYDVQDFLITSDNRIRLADVIGYDNPFIIVTKTKINGWDGREDSYLVVITTQRLSET